MVRVVRRGEAHGIVAAEAAGVGEVVTRIVGVESTTPTRFSLQVGPSLHIEPAADAPLDGTYAWRFMNHSCDPNCEIRGRDVVALRPIAEGEEITYDYATTEEEMAEPFRCGCGSPHCRGEIRGFRYLSTEDRERLRPRLADHLLALLDAED